MTTVLVTMLVSGTIAAPANAAYTIKPKVGQCFQYTKAQVSAKYAPKNPIKCSSSHNMETFAVATWPVDTNPVDMDRETTLGIVGELCDFWGTFPNAYYNRMKTTDFNYWAWYTPDRAGWAKGQRWLRCDAMIGRFASTEQWPPAIYVSWKGLKLYTSY
jgi:hypothetical protein